MTTVSEIIGQAMIIIDDIRMQQELAVSPAQFYRTFFQYLEVAMTQVTKPPELYEYIVQNYHKPTYGDYTWVSTTESTSSTTLIETGMPGFELVSGTIVSVDGTRKTPYSDFTYDTTTGNITMPVQQADNIEYVFDMYTDGYYDNITARMERLLAEAFAIIWDERFQRNWLNMTPKLQDSSFSVVNEANYMSKLTERMTANRLRFSDELRNYEQDFAYRNTVGGIKPNTIFI